MNKLRRTILLVDYYLFARHLPSTSMPGGRFANYIRTYIASRLFKECGSGLVVKRGAYFGTGYEIIIGNNSQIGEDARIEHDTVIGNNVMMGLQVLILSTRHAMSRTDIPLINQGYLIRKPVHVGDDVWIGARAMLLPGVVVGDHSIIGAGALVTKDVEPWSVVGGVPAKKIKSRLAAD